MKLVPEVPKSLNLAARRNDAIPQALGSATAVFAAEASNAEVVDTEGRRYVDFAGGIGVLGTGHRHPRIIAAVSEQLKRYTHTAFQVMAYEPYVQLAERLNAIAPVGGKAKTVLFTTGAEAVENAVKIARMVTGRRAVIAFTGAFHGRTAMALGLTGKVMPYKRTLGPPDGGIFRIPFPVAHRGVSSEMTLASLDSLFSCDIAPTEVAAIIIEPVQGEGGFHVAPPEFLQRLREICDTHGILLIADEIQSGFGRTGRMFAVEHSGVKPDLITLAKSLAGGFPLSAVVGRAEVMDRIPPGGIGGTYAGSPVGCVAALAVLDVIAEERLLARADVIGARIRAAFTEIEQRRDIVLVANLRGLGAMLAFDVLSDAGKPDGASAKAVAARALAGGLIILSSGAFGETLRILVPLTISDSMLEKGLGILERALLKPGAAV